MKLNIGCGNKAIDGYVGVDKFQCDAADYICDIENEKLPFDDGSVGAIMLDNVIEHFGDIPKVINELIRVSKKGGVIKIITPHFSALSSWIDPTHIHHLSYFSWCKLQFHEVYQTPHTLLHHKLLLCSQH